MAALKKGDSGAKITELHKNLKKAGFDPKEGGPKFTEKTEDAVKKFQKSKGIKQSGELDSKTADALKAAVSGGGSGGKGGDKKDAAAGNWPYGNVAANKKANEKVRELNQEREAEIIKEAEKSGAGAADLVKKIQENNKAAEAAYKEWLKVAETLAAAEKEYQKIYKSDAAAANKLIEDHKKTDAEYTKKRIAWQEVIDKGKPFADKAWKNLVSIKNLKWEYEDPQFKLREFETTRKEEKSALVERLKTLKERSGPRYDEMAKELADIDQSIDSQFKKVKDPLTKLVDLQKKFDAAVKQSDFDAGRKVRNDATLQMGIVGRAEKEWDKLARKRDRLHKEMDQLMSA